MSPANQSRYQSSLIFDPPSIFVGGGLLFLMNFFSIVADLFKITNYSHHLGYLPCIVWLSLLHEAMRGGGVEESGRMCPRVSALETM